MHPDNNQFAIGTIDGRAHLGTIIKDNFSSSIKIGSTMTFKCHKIEDP